MFSNLHALMMQRRFDQSLLSRRTQMLKTLSRTCGPMIRKPSLVTRSRKPGFLVAPVLVIAFLFCGKAFGSADSPLLLQLQISAMTGDLQPVESLADSLDESTLDPLNLLLLRQFRARFTDNSEQFAASSESSLANSAIVVYQDYWRAALTGSLAPDQAEKQLQGELRTLLRKQYPDYRAGEDVFTQLQQALAAQQLESSLGQTPPWRDLYIWAHQESRRYRVELTDVEQSVDVTLIDQPLVQGWQHFASLDLNTTSGWATADGLYCLCWSYDLDSEAFKVNWLKHETRHLVDFREFPGLSEAEMEYRAKLTELAFSGNQVSETLRQFANNAAADSPSPHASANYRVSQEIYREIFQRNLPEHLDPWTLLGPARVAPAAVLLLERNTERLRQEAVQGLVEHR